MNSKQTFDNIKDLIKANYPLIYTVTSEYYRTKRYISDMAFKHGYSFHVWDCVNNLKKQEKKGNEIDYQEIINCADYNGALNYISTLIEEKDTQDTKDIFIFEDLHRYFDQVETFTRLRKLAEKLRMYDKHIIMIGPFVKIPDELEKFVTVVTIPLPDRKDLEKNLNYISGDKPIDEDLKKYFIDSALGMTDTEAFLAFKLAKQKVGLDTKEAAQIISMEKEQIIKKSGILDYYQVNQDLESSLGGLDNLKDWLRKREKSFQRKAKDFGLQEPKGILLVGVPGCGKSLTAKCVAAEWKQPFLKLDIEKVFQAEVEASENKIRKAIEQGQIAQANAYLGQPYQVSGFVSRGLQNGRSIGFPTANVHLTETEKILPADGVYAVSSEFNGAKLYGMMNIGWRPTIQEAKTERKIEVHFFDFQEDIYEAYLALSLHDRIRSEQKFENLEALRIQLKHDEQAVRAYFQG